ncbi:hypothetical protein MWMV17_MWMV17_02478 [Acinetobacter calcoaceticus]|uniref:Uncharacterized protein n=1 Tax=Acinetobacter calcoaceticus DSM 30006 = CIP 81.8 TaxID=981331 RepID=A0ABP2UHN7_ACICA|nr:hypothetical protein F936_03013 [Acinetobacter calcoaceticus DSM 30006 = CIP 81.8]CAI3146496.1 hypothetical protein MWMV17_MWMV17_02478 [Acinetobacter calcoaceticus]SUU52514.1 Uncharacterised protein [Acinetobacter calcoaceticus]
MNLTLVTHRPDDLEIVKKIANEVVDVTHRPDDLEIRLLVPRRCRRVTHRPDDLESKRQCKFGHS